MFNRDQILTLMMIRQREGNLFSSLPKEISNSWVHSYITDDKHAEDVDELFNTLNQGIIELCNTYKNDYYVFENKHNKIADLVINFISRACNDETNSTKKLLLLIGIIQGLQQYFDILIELKKMQSSRLKNLVDQFIKDHYLAPCSVSKNLPYYTSKICNWIAHDLYESQTLEPSLLEGRSHLNACKGAANELLRGYYHYQLEEELLKKYIQIDERSGSIKSISGPKISSLKPIVESFLIEHNKREARSKVRHGL